MKQQSPRTVALLKRMLLAAALFAAPLFATAQQVITYGSQGSSGNNAPFLNAYQKAITQQIYKSSYFNLPDGGTITKLGYNCAAATTSDFVAPHVIIYMGNTTRTNFVKNNLGTWFALSSLTKVYEGTGIQTNTTGWKDITLDTPFDYDGTNLVVVISKSGTVYSDLTYYCTDGDANTVIVYPNDSIVPTSKTGITTNRALPDMRITITPASTCYAPTALSLSSITTNFAVASWSAPTDGTAPVAYEVSCMTGTSAPVKTVVTTTSAPLSGLLPSSYYTLSVRSICGVGDTSKAATLPFATLCTEYTLPFADRLNEAQSYSAFDVANRLPICWEFPGLATANDAYPQAYVDMTKNLVLATTSAAPAVAVMPAIADNLDSTMLSFTVALHPSVTLEYGFVTVADDSSSFVPMGSVVNGRSYSFDLSEAIELIPLGSRIAFRATTVDAVRRTALLSAISLVDAPTCKTPIKLAIDSLNLTQNSFRITWGGTMNDGDVYRFRYTVLGSNDTTTVTDITARNYTASGLPEVGQFYSVLIDKTCANNQTSG